MKKRTALLLCSLLLSLAAQRVAALELTVINGAALDDALMSEVLTFCNEQLPFTLSAKTETLSCETPETCQDTLEALKTETDAALIGLIRLDDPNFHQAINTNRLIALINVTPLLTDDPRTSAWRLERMIMRSVAFLLGIPPAPDPNCVTRNYESLEDFDTMGRNFTPPYNPVIPQKALELSITLDPEPTDGTRTPASAGQ